MLLFISLGICLALFIAPVVPVEIGVNTQCSEYGDCVDKNVEPNAGNEHNSSNISNAAELGNYYEITDEYGNRTYVDIKHLLSTLTEKHDNYDKIQRDVEFVFQGVIAAVILFGVCASLCVITACIYCCRINIIDNRLKDDVEALTEKLKRDCRFKKSTKKAPLEPVAESCNIIVGDAGVFCV